MSATTAQFIAAEGDGDLLGRFIAKAKLMGVDNPQSLIQGNYAKLLTTVVAEGQTVVDVYAYASTSREQYIAAIPPAPGVNPGAVTDAYLETAINAVLPPQETPPA